MKARILVFFFILLGSASSFAARYRVFSLKGTATATNRHGTRPIQTILNRVGQEFFVNNPSTDIVPSKGGKIQVVEIVAGVARLTNITDCAPQPCFSTINIAGSKKRDLEDFAFNNNLVALKAVSTELRNQNVKMKMDKSQIQSQKLNPQQTPALNNVRIIDKAAVKQRN